VRMPHQLNQYCDSQPVIQALARRLDQAGERWQRCAISYLTLELRWPISMRNESKYGVLALIGSCQVDRFSPITQKMVTSTQTGLPTRWRSSIRRPCQSGRFLHFILSEHEANLVHMAASITRNRRPVPCPGRLPAHSSVSTLTVSA